MELAMYKFNLFLFLVFSSVGNLLPMGALNLKTCITKNLPILCVVDGKTGYMWEGDEAKKGPVACCCYLKKGDSLDDAPDCRSVYCGDPEVFSQELVSPFSGKPIDEKYITGANPTCCQCKGCFCNCKRVRKGCVRQICCKEEEYEGTDLLELATCFCCGNCLDKNGRFIPSVGATVCFNDHCQCLLCSCEDEVGDCECGCLCKDCMSEWGEAVHRCDKCCSSKYCPPCGGLCCNPSGSYTSGQVQRLDNTLCCAALILALKYGSLAALSSL